MNSGSEFSYGVMRADEAPELAQILSRCFAATQEAAALWIERARPGNARVVRAASGPVGGLLLIPMGQWLLGKRLPMTGIAAVGVAPQVRGSGAATYLMRAAVKELDAAGVPLSVLFPSTQSLYRRAGYEIAGSYCEVRVPLSELPRPHERLDIRPAKAEDRDLLETLYRRVACNRHGYLDRGPYVWNRIFQPNEGDAEGYIASYEGEPEGYVFFRREMGPHPRKLDVTDLVATTKRSALALFGLLGNHGTLIDTARWFAGADDPRLMLLEDQRYKVRLDMHWMLRIVDVAAALQLRGYPAQVSGELHLEIDDPLLQKDSARFVLAVRDGVAEVRTGGNGDLRIGVLGLAPLWTGHQTAEALRLAGFLEASDGICALAGALFSAAPPSVCDHF